MRKLAPIVLFTYNRVWHTQQTIEALQKNELAKESELFIYSDGGKDEVSWQKVNEVREYLKTVDGFKNINFIFQEKNIGLADSIISGVTKIVNQFGKIIVLEDDIVTSPYFLKYMNTNLDYYEYEYNVACIHAYIYPVDDLPEIFFLRGADCWGWATWRNKWENFEIDGTKLLEKLQNKKLEYEFDFNGSYPYTTMLKNQIKHENNSWAIRWYASAFLKNLLCLYPGKTYIQNIGLDGSGAHCGIANCFLSDFVKDNIEIKKIECKEDVNAKYSISNYLKGLK